ncbi:hypothetical protein [Rhizobium terrae]|uniref:hypothetical protein n=1 Tax=Rhizobium terrae TaxID=2171756 RepID=UPI000E3E59C2|nr:hypothetical protein [Rhizobium terrae]
MTDFPRSPKILKGAIVGIDIFNPIASVVVFQYNPEQLTRSLDPQYSDAAGARTEALRLGGPPHETISATINIDVIDQLEEADGLAATLGLYPQLSALEMLVYPKSALVIANTALLATGTIEIVPPAAPLTLFIYGWKRVVPVKVSSLSITETAHDPQLNPIRATADIGMRVLTYSDLPLTHPGYWAFMAHQVVKETMAVIGSVSNIGAVLGDDVNLF